MLVEIGDEHIVQPVRDLACTLPDGHRVFQIVPAFVSEFRYRRFPPIYVTKTVINTIIDHHSLFQTEMGYLDGVDTQSFHQLLGDRTACDDYIGTILAQSRDG